MSTPLRLSNLKNVYGGVELDKHVLTSIHNLIEVLMCKGHHCRALMSENTVSQRTAIARINAMVVYFIPTAFFVK